MDVTITLPDELSRWIGRDADEIPRWLLERAGLEAYRAGEITARDLRLMLGFDTRMELHGFLKSHDVFLRYDADDFRQDGETSRAIEQARSR